MESRRIVRTNDSSEVSCLNCGRFLWGKFVQCNNDEGYHVCPCGYLNYFTLIGDHKWEVSLKKNKPIEPKKKSLKQLKLPF